MVTGEQGPRIAPEQFVADPLCVYTHTGGPRSLSSPRLSLLLLLLNSQLPCSYDICHEYHGFGLRQQPINPPTDQWTSWCLCTAQLSTCLWLMASQVSTSTYWHVLPTWDPDRSHMITPAKEKARQYVFDSQVTTHAVVLSQSYGSHVELAMPMATRSISTYNQLFK